MISRFFDLFLALTLLIVIIGPSILLSLLIKFSSKGPIFHWSKRVGKENKIFLMPKFRTMYIDTPDIATHELKNPDQYITSIGVFMRKSSLDELPQIYSVLLGDMSFVGPRPALHNQYNLIELRKKRGIDLIKPGITGWAQVNGRDELSINEKVKYDEEYLLKASLLIDIHIIWLTIIKAIRKDGVSH